MAPLSVSTHIHKCVSLDLTGPLGGYVKMKLYAFLGAQTQKQSGCPLTMSPVLWDVGDFVMEASILKDLHFLQESFIHALWVVGHRVTHQLCIILYLEIAFRSKNTFHIKTHYVYIYIYHIIKREEVQ